MLDTYQRVFGLNYSLSPVGFPEFVMLERSDAFSGSVWSKMFSWPEALLPHGTAPEPYN